MSITSPPGLSLIECLDIRTKITGFCGIILLAFLFEHPLYNLVVALIVSVLAYLVRLSGKSIRNMLTPLFPLFICIMLITGFAYSPDKFHYTAKRIIG